MHEFKNFAKICKNMHIQTEANESLFNDSYRFLKFHMIGESKKNMLFHALLKPTHYTSGNLYQIIKRLITFFDFFLVQKKGLLTLSIVVVPPNSSKLICVTL
jgi:hypothetical protein